MPISFEFVDDGKGVVLMASGRTTGSDFIDATNELLSFEDRSKNVRYALVDLCGVSEFDISAAEVRQIVALNRKGAELDPHRLAVAIAATKRVVLGLARMWELLVDWDGWNIHICHSFPEAEKWVRDEMAREQQFPDGDRSTGGGCV